MILTFTDFSLPGNAGMDLTWQRVHNSKLQGGWTFGIPGVPMFIEQAEERTGPFGFIAPLPIFHTADGGAHLTFRVSGSEPVYMSKQFWKFNRGTDAVSLPDGWTAQYGILDTTGSSLLNPLGVNTRYLTRIADVFDNALLFEYTETAPFRLTKIIQELQNGQSREVTIEYDAGRVTAVRHGTRTWTYAYEPLADGHVLSAVTPPVGPAWRYEYSTARDLTKVTTPNGGEITYKFDDHVFLLTQPPGDIIVNSRVVLERAVGGRDIFDPGTWSYTYGSLPGQSTTIEGPAQRIVYDFETGAALGQPGRFRIFDGSVTVQDEDLTWESGPAVGTHPLGENANLQRLRSRVIARDGNTYSTDYQYGAANFGDYNRPTLIAESGGRITTREFDYVFTPYIAGKISFERITVGTQSFDKSWGYDDATGFRTSETVYELTTEFTPDVLGNVGTSTDGNGRTTTFTYTWGAVKDTLTPEYPIVRAINPDGTIASVTQGGRTTTFLYDDLQRLTQTQPPGASNAINVVHDNTGGTAVVVSRGASGTETRLDGFGRPISTVNSVGVRTSTRYDADGRVIYEGYPFVGTADIGTTITYDVLGRVRRRTNPRSELHGEHVRRRYCHHPCGKRHQRPDHDSYVTGIW